jgi:hypothetical protein
VDNIEKLWQTLNGKEQRTIWQKDGGQKNEAEGWMDASIGDDVT